jgi:hypothetical protein
MAWTRLKAKVEELFATSLRGRVTIHMTSYRGGVSEGGRGWLLIDRAELPLAAIQPWDAEPTPGHHTQWSLHDALVAYLALAFPAAVSSTDPVHRGLALIDRRLGRRRFEALRLSPEEHPVVVRLYRLRAEAEGWRSAVAGAA